MSFCLQIFSLISKRIPDISAGKAGYIPYISLNQSKWDSLVIFTLRCMLCTFHIKFSKLGTIYMQILKVKDKFYHL